MHWVAEAKFGIFSFWQQCIFKKMWDIFFTTKMKIRKTKLNQNVPMAKFIFINLQVVKIVIILKIYTI